MTQFIAVVAYDDDYGIGKDGGIPWNIPEDKWLYRQLVSGGVTISSRLSFARKSKNQLGPRRSLILSKSGEDVEDAQNQEIYHSKTDILEHVKNEPVVYVCGGGQIYKLFADEITKVIATEVSGTHGADTFFDIGHKKWQKKIIAQFNNDIKAKLTTYQRSP